jgi:hypothetical protein
MADNDEDERLNQLLKNVPPEQAVGIVKQIADMVMRQLKDEVVPRIVHESFDGIRQRLGLTNAVLGAVEDLTVETGDTKEDVLFKALALYEAAVRARKKGQRLVLVERDYHFVREIIGFDQENQESLQKQAVAR